MYFDSFGIGYIPGEVLSKIKDKSITNNIFRMHSDDSIMCRFYFIIFIEYMIAETKLCLFIPILFSPNDYKRKGKIIYKYFKDKYGKR